MAEIVELYKVILEDGSHVWAGVIGGCPFIGRNDRKVAKLMEILGLGIVVDSGKDFSVKEFLNFANQHPLLSLVPDWAEMGIKIKIYES